MPKFSLIIPTVGRTTELEKMLESLLHQQPTDFEVILVDQNEDNRIEKTIASLQGSVPVQHIRLKTKNVSAARNTGLSLATGEIVAFPDDDCWYPAHLLPLVGDWFAANSEYDILAVGANDEHGVPSGNRWIQSKCDIRPLNVFRTTFCNSLFFRRGAIPVSIRFDDKLIHGEETDFILRLMSSGLRARFDRTLHVGHPRRDMLSGSVSVARAHKYGQGMGSLVRRHSFLSLWLLLLGYDLLRVLVVTLTGKFSQVTFCAAHARGLFQGFVFDHADKS
jgi:glycosyltransferase involved in cell wall biosynthesis